MINIYFISDMHFGHDKLYPDYRGMTLKECENLMITNWNNTVGLNDKIYVIGDVAMKKESLKILSQLNGKKYLIQGNHDIYKLKSYITYFSDRIAGAKVLEGVHYNLDYDIILTHIPIHPSQLSRYQLNIHGHLHKKIIDKGYFNVSVENINYTPISLSQILTLLNN